MSSQPQPQPQSQPLQPQPQPPPYRARARYPYVTWVLLALNLGEFLLERIPGFNGQVWTIHLAQERARVWEGEYWRLFTALFLHHSMVLHIGMNMIALLLLGRVMERILGPWRFLFLYLVTGLSGSLFFQAFSTGAVAIGASGAVYGVFGALLLVSTSRTLTGDLVPGWKLFRWTVLILSADQLMAYLFERGQAGVSIGVSAHFGGLLAGNALGYVVTPRPLGNNPRVQRRRLVVLGVFTVALTGIGVYGCFYPVHSDDWQEQADLRAIVRELEKRNVVEAVRLWRDLEVEDDGFKRQMGYRLFDDLMVVDQKELAESVLDELIASAEKRLRSDRPGEAPTPELLNELAWYYAMRETHLKEAQSLADEAVRRVRARGQAGWWKAFRRHEALVLESQVVNTRGWVALLLGDYDEALRDLKAAAELLPLGVNFLYLALAYDHVGNEEAAREAARTAASMGGLTAWEARMLEELRADLGGI